MINRVRIKLIGCPDIRCVAELVERKFTEYAYHNVRFPAQGDRTADDGGIAVEVPLPDRSTEDDDPGPAGTILVLVNPRPIVNGAPNSEKKRAET